MTRNQLSRRDAIALGLGTVVLASCGPTAHWRAQPAATRRPAALDAATGATRRLPCSPTEANIEGPYYRPDAPFRQSLLDPTTFGTPLVLQGRVLSLDCHSALADAVLDVWHADAHGHYDNDGSMPAGPFRLRGRVRCDENGCFSVSTIVPGRYLNERTYRPAHVHVKLAASGHRPLTTQLYFPGDPYNDADPFIRRSLLLDVSRGRGGYVGHYGFVLQPI